ncbi:MAG: glycosyltransferase family 9 protein [Candidatus Brocadiia bacterium]
MSGGGEGPRVAVLRPGALGDAVLTLPVLESLTAAFPAASLLAVGSAGFELAVDAGLAASRVAFDDVRLLGLFAPEGTSPLLAGCERCLCYGPGRDERLAANLRRSGVGRLVAWPARPSGGMHAVDHLLGAVEAAGCPVATRAPRLAPQAGWLAAARSRLDAAGVGEGFLALHPGSGGRAKRWPAERFAELAARLGGEAVWLLGPAERDDEELRAVARSAGAVVAGPSLRELAGLLALCGLYVGNDSGVSHLAAAVGSPTVAVFGATDPRVWSPRGRAVGVVDGWERGGVGGVAMDEVLAAAERLGELSPGA